MDIEDDKVRVAVDSYHLEDSISPTLAIKHHEKFFEVDFLRFSQCHAGYDVQWHIQDAFASIAVYCICCTNLGETMGLIRNGAGAACRQTVSFMSRVASWRVWELEASMVPDKHL